MKTELINSKYLNIPLFGGTLFELPKELNNPKKGLINLRNNDDKSFLWCHVRHLNPVNDHSTRIKKEDKKIVDTPDYTGVIFSISANDYSKIEDQNDIGINVFSYEDKIVCPIYISQKYFDNSMNILMIYENEKSHYVYIKDFNRLMYNKTRHGEKKWFCMRCLQHFSSKIILNKHKENCLIINGEQKIELNTGYISFKNYSNKIRVPFKIYADFECILKRTEEYNDDNNKDSSSTVKMQDHVACGFGYKGICIDDNFTNYVVIYRGKDCVNKFIDAILDEYEYCKKIMKYHFNKNLIMSIEEKELFQKANKCWICDKLLELIDEKVRDHCHITGKFRGASHFSCNANFKITERVPVIFHNLKGYDGQLIMKELSNFDVVIDVIPYGLEKYMAIIVNRNLVFIDSMRFMKDTLDDLVKNLVEEGFNYLSKEFLDKRLKLLKQKGVYPYEYMSSFKKFDECELPSKDKFYSSLKGKGISDEDYKRAKKVWNVFNFKNLGEYHDLYLKTDVSLLCDVFENFFNICVEYYDLDPCHYFSIPGLAWDAMLKMTGVKLRLIDDIDIHLFIEKGMHGGVSCIVKRHCKATINMLKIMIKIKKIHSLRIGMSITYMDGQCLNICHMIILNGWVREKLIKLILI